MSATVWSKFYWSDWLSDAGLRRSSFAARGLWIDMLCIAAQSDPIGYLTVKKVPLSVNDIARMCGGSEPEVGTLIAELERNGVLSRDRNGTIYSRRIIRDDKKTRTAQKNGKKGGNPSLWKREENPSSDNLPDKGDLKPHIPEATYQKEKIGAAEADYIFEGRVIRLKQTDFDRWRKAYRAIPDLMPVLQAADDYYFENKPPHGKWFFPVSRWLERENVKAQTGNKRAGYGTDWF